MTPKQAALHILAKHGIWESEDKTVLQLYNQVVKVTGKRKQGNSTADFLISLVESENQRERFVYTFRPYVRKPHMRQSEIDEQPRMISMS